MISNDTINNLFNLINTLKEYHYDEELMYNKILLIFILFSSFLFFLSSFIQFFLYKKLLHSIYKKNKLIK